MNRIKTYHAIIQQYDNIAYIPTPQNKFYHTIHKKLDKIDTSLDETSRYIDVLVQEEKYIKILHEIKDLFQILEMDMNKDESMVYDGIKAILNIKLNILKNKIKTKKTSSGRVKIELEPEVPQFYAQSSHDSLLQKEHEKILEKVDTFQSTRQRVLDIQQIQDLIGVHIEAQNERIDMIQVDTHKATENIKNTQGYVNNDGGKVLRRFLFVFILCMTFVLCFLHVQYK